MLHRPLAAVVSGLLLIVGLAGLGRAWPALLRLTMTGAVTDVILSRRAWTHTRAAPK